jgi:cardiolipin synthase A/B
MDQSAGAKDTFDFYPRTSQAWDAMYDDCAAATKSIEFEQYIIMNDAVGRRFLELFRDKARAGVRVRLLLDCVGCRSIRVHPLVDEIRAAGGAVNFYNALGWNHLFFPASWYPRSHIKTLLVDGQIAHTGSVCLWGMMRDWHDLQLRVTGAPTAWVRHHFAHTWKCLGEECAEFPEPEAQDAVRYLVSEPHLRPSGIYRELLEAIRGARERIRIVTPYFVPPRRLRRALRKAAQRNVRVEILTSARTDVPLADHASRYSFAGLLRNGLKIYLYPHEVLHAKYAMIDRDWAMVGSINMDYLSLLKNREAAIVFKHSDAIDRMWALSDGYVRDSRQADMEYCRAIPLPHRIAGYLAYQIRWML